MATQLISETILCGMHILYLVRLQLASAYQVQSSVLDNITGTIKDARNLASQNIK